MVVKKSNWLEVILVVCVTTFVTFCLTASIFQTKIDKKAEQVKNLEHLVEYHQQQTFDLVQELHDIKNPGE